MKTIISWLLFIALTLGLNSAPAQIGFWQNAASGSSITILNNWKNKTDSGASLSVTVSPTAGKALVVAVATGAASYTITDNNSSVYTSTPVESVFGTTVGFSFLGSAASGTTSITVTPATTDIVQVFVFEVDNVSTYTAGEYNVNFFVGATAWDSTTVTTATADSIVFHIASGATGSDSTTFSGWTNSFASFGSNSWYGTGSGSFATDVSYRIVSSAAGYSSTVTSSVGTNGVSIIAAFH